MHKLLVTVLGVTTMLGAVAANADCEEKNIVIAKAERLNTGKPRNRIFFIEMIYAPRNALMVPATPLASRITTNPAAA